MSFDATKLVIINDSHAPDVRGDVSIYADLSQARRGLEAIDVINRAYFGFLGDGTVLRLSTRNEVVEIEPDPSIPKNPNVVRRLLEEMAHAIPESSLTKRGIRRPSMHYRDLPLETLIEVIGLTRG